MLKVYLAGKMGGLTEEEVSRWRIKAKELMQDFAVVKDPTSFVPPSARSVVSTNKIQIMNCQVVLAEMDHKEVSIGTVGEIIFAHENAIPVVVWGRYWDHPWIVEHSVEQFRTLEEATDYIRETILPCYGVI